MKCSGFPSWLQVFLSVRLAFLLRSDDRVEGIVEPLHRQIHHLSEGVVLGAFVLVAHWLIGGGADGNTQKERQKKEKNLHQPTVFRLTRVSKQMWIVFPSTVTEMFFSSLKSTLSSPNMSLSADREKQTYRDSQAACSVLHCSQQILHRLGLSVTHCSMTPSRVWKTSMSMTVVWHSITGDANKSDELRTGRQAAKGLSVRRRSPTDLSELSGSTGPPEPQWWRHQRTCHSEGWRSTAAERTERHGG